jgi:hypothetical protein
MLENWANRGDYETLGIAINKGARAFTNEYSPIAQSVKNRTEYSKRLQDAYDKGSINANTYQGKLAQSDYSYQGIQYDENGNLIDGSIYQGRSFFHDVDITQKVTEYMKNIKPFIRENMGTDIPYNEDFEITNTRGDKGEVAYWIRTKSKTSQIPDELIQMAVSEVMSDPDVQASLVQEIDLNTYRLGEIDPESGLSFAEIQLNDAIQNGDLKEEDVRTLIEGAGSPLRALQEILYNNAVARETQLAVGTYGGQRTLASGRTVTIDALFKTKKENEAENINTQFNKDDISYSETVFVSPLSISYEDAVEKRGEYLSTMRDALALIDATENTILTDEVATNYASDRRSYYLPEGHPDKNVAPLGPTEGEGLDVDNLSDLQVVQYVQKHLDSYKTASNNATQSVLEYMDWKVDNAPAQTEGETATQYSDRIYTDYLNYVTEIEQKRAFAIDQLNETAKLNDLDIGKYHSVMSGLSSDMQLYSVTDQKINIKLPELAVGDHTNLSYGEYAELKGQQLNNTIITAVGGDDWFMGQGLQLFTLKNPWLHDNITFELTGQDIVNVYNELNPNKPINNLLDFKGLALGTLGPEIFNMHYYEDIEMTTLVLKALMRKENPNADISDMAAMGQYAMNNQKSDAAEDIVDYIEDMLDEEEAKVKNAFADKFDDTPIAVETMIMTNFGSDYETSGQVNEALQNFFKENAIPSQLQLKAANGETLAGFDARPIKDHHIGKYEIITNQIGVTNMEVGGEAQLYIPVKLANGNTVAFLADASQISIPALNEYLNSAEFEVNKKWISGIQQRLDKYVPAEYANVTFDYKNNTVIIDDEVHTKEQGLKILTENILRYRRYTNE